MYPFNFVCFKSGTQYCGRFGTLTYALTRIFGDVILD